MPCNLYCADISNNSRTIMLALKAAEIDSVNLKKMDMMKGEHKSEEMKKMNPFMCLPTIDDNGFYLWESRPIMCYLVDKYGKKEDLYPRDPQKRSMVHKWLYFDLSNTAKTIADYVVPFLFAHKPLDAEVAKKIKECLKKVDCQLGKSKHICGDQLTIADLPLLTNITMLELTKWDFSDTPNVQRWLNDMKALPYYAECMQGLEDMKKMLP